MQPRRFVVLSLSSAFGLGYVPLAPGTFGTLAALPLWWLARAWPTPGFAAAVALLTLAAIAIASQAERLYGGHDTQSIVIDEVAGMLVSVVGVPFHWPEALAAFVLFRFFDAVKPQPIAWLDRHIGGGTGVVLDDVAAGVVVCGLLHGARLLLGGWL